VERDSVAQSRAATATARGSSSHQKAVVIIGWKAVVIARGQRPSPGDWISITRHAWRVLG
jgi:hypothetical protein